MLPLGVTTPGSGDGLADAAGAAPRTTTSRTPARGCTVSSVRLGAAILPRAVRIGVAKEIKTDEYRVALTPAGARELVRKGHDVLVETGAGDGSSMSDADYERAGATVVSVDEAWERAEMLLKVKEPIEAEYRRLRGDLVLLTYLDI